jgi:hypothetical protein
MYARQRPQPGRCCIFACVPATSVHMIWASIRTDVMAEGGDGNPVHFRKHEHDRFGPSGPVRVS